MRSAVTFLWMTLGCLAFGLQTRSEEPFAKTVFEAKSGSKVAGTALFLKQTDRLIVRLDVSNLTPGEHALHVHENGDCSGKTASNSGEHFNPEKQPHGAPAAGKKHAGDFGNFDVPKDGHAKADIEIPMPPVKENTVMDWDIYIGKSLVIHQGKDDFKSQPAGNSGDKIACGVITAIKPRG